MVKLKSKTKAAGAAANHAFAMVCFLDKLKAVDQSATLCMRFKVPSGDVVDKFATTVRELGLKVTKVAGSKDPALLCISCEKGEGCDEGLCTSSDTEDEEDEDEEDEEEDEEDEG